MKSRLQARLVSLRGNLFFVPSVYVLVAVGFAFASLAVDAELTRKGTALPPLLDATVDSARALLGTVASATITFAAIAFSVSLVMIQQVASQFSSRVLRGFFRDTFSKRVMGIALGTFAYCLFVLRAVRHPAEDNGEAVVPYLSVFVAVLLGVVTVLAIVAFIHHSAHSMEAAEIIGRITDETKAQIRRLCPRLGHDDDPPQVLAKLPDAEPFVVRATSDGWVQRIDHESLFDAIPKHGILRLDAGVGMFVAEGAPLATFWPSPRDPKRSTTIVRRSMRLGRTRTMEQDMALGLRQLVDIALRALSPGINDPTTAQEAIVNLGSVLRELLLRELPDRVISDGDTRRIFRPHDFSHRDYVRLAFDQIERTAKDDPSVTLTMLQTLGPIVDDLDELELKNRAAWLRAEAQRILDRARHTSLRDDEREGLHAVAQRLRLVEHD